LSCSSPSPDVLANVTFARSSIDVPAGAAAALEHALHARKIPTLGIWAQVPHYVAAMAYPAASVALLDGFAEVTGITIPATDLRGDVTIQRERIDKSVGENPEHLAMLRQLEEIYDAADGERERERAADEPALEMQSGDELAAEIQRFLNEQD
jgi:PAC2 family